MRLRTNKIKIFEAYVLRILSVQFILAGVIYFYYKQWWAGIVLIVMSFLFGAIGQGLKHNRAKSTEELTQGQDWNILEVGEPDNITTEEANLIGKAFLPTWFILFITLTMLLFHHNIVWYAVLPLSFFIGALYPILLFFLGFF
jgi:hypothetical protein